MCFVNVYLHFPIECDFNGVLELSLPLEGCCRRLSAKW